MLRSPPSFPTTTMNDKRRQRRSTATVAGGPSPSSPRQVRGSPSSSSSSSGPGVVARVALLLSSMLLILVGSSSRILSTCDAFAVIPTPATSDRAARGRTAGSSSSSSSFTAMTSLFVSVGLGPQQDGTQAQPNQPGGGAATAAGDAPLVAGIDYEVPVHENYRTSRRSKFDERCDEWFAGLLMASSSSSRSDNNKDGNEVEEEETAPTLGCLGELAELAHQALVTPVPLLNEFEKQDRNDPDWTPYVSTKLPWTPLTPAYGLEQYGMPVPRRGAEAWRQFDVNGLVSQPYTTLMMMKEEGGSSSSSNNLPTTMNLEHVRSNLEAKGAWLSDESCEGRLVYVNGEYVEALSKPTSEIYNLQSCPSKDTDLYKVLGRYTDGFTDELMDVDRPGESERLLSRLSGPNHRVGPAISQFAVNTQQGTACFAALNTLQVRHVAVVRSSGATTAPAVDDAEEGGSSSSSNSNHKNIVRPVLVVQAFTGDAGLGDGDDGAAAAAAAADAPPSAVGNVRVVILAGEGTSLSVQQCQVDLDNDDNDDQQQQQQHLPRHVPKLVNSYTQIVARESANVSYALLDLVGGLVTPNVEAGDDNNDSDSNSDSSSAASSPRQVEATRPQLRDTVFNTVDAHVYRGAALSYAGVQMGGSGRDRLAVSVSLLQAGASAALNGFCLSGGAQRCETKTNVHHIGGATTCRQVQKNLVGGRSTTSFRGRIRVEQDAQQADAQQLSRSILLTDKARAWSVPSLEIIADDVKCSHGTTVSDLSEEELFYLTSRGIGRNTARKLLMYAFASDVCASVDECFRDSVRHQALARLENLVPQGGRAVKGEFQSI